MVRRIQQSNSAREVLGDLRSRVPVVVKLNELNRKRSIQAFGSQHDLIRLADGLKSCRPGKAGRQIPEADGFAALPDGDGGSRQVAFILLVGPFAPDRDRLRADLQKWL